MFTISRPVRLVFASLIVAVMIGLTGCSNPAPEPGASNSVSKGSDAAIRTSLKADAASMVNGLAAVNATDGKYPVTADISELANLVSVQLNHGNYVSDYGLSSDGSAFTITLSNNTLTTDKSIQYSSNTGLYRTM